MKITVQNLIIDRDMVLKPSQQVWQWEVPVLQEKYGESKVRLMDTAEVERDGLPDAGEEYVRLVRAHGINGGDGGTNLSYVEHAYGRGRSGVAALEKVMKGGFKKPRKPRKPRAVTETPKPAVEVEKGDGDPLDI